MNRHHPFAFSRSAMAIAVAIVAAAPALAQNTTAGINGRVTGADGQPIAGAAVSIVHVDSGSTTNVTTDGNGRYSARGLRPGGPYTVTVSRGGVVDKREGISLALAENLSLDSSLGAQTITITGRGVSETFNNDKMGSGTAISNRELNEFASIQRSLQDYARLDPRLAQTDKDRGEISAAGQNTRFNSVTIDGVTINDTFGLEANNLPTVRQPISIEAIQSVQINLSNYDVTQKGYTGANINAVTKSGTNDFHGSLYYVWRDDNLVGDRYNRTTDTYFAAPAFKEDTKGFTLGGPIFKDRLFFFVNYEQFKSSRTSPDFGPLGAANTNVGITQGAIDSATAIAKNTYGIDIGTSGVPGGLEQTLKTTTVKLDWNISDQHRASLLYNKAKQGEPFLTGFSATGLSLSSYWYDQRKDIESIVGQWFADWTPDFSTEFKLSRRTYRSEPVPINGVRLPQVGLRFSGDLPPGSASGVSANDRFLNFGTERSRQFNVLETKTNDAYFGATYVAGAHEIKAGADYSDNKIYNAFLQDVNGQYTFGCEIGSYSFGTVGTGPGAAAANCNGLSSAQRDQATLENFQRGLPSFYQVQTPLAGRALADGVSIFSYKNTGLFVQDTWKLSPTLNLMGGLRVDQQDVPTEPLRNDKASAAVGPVNTKGEATGGFGIDNTQTLDGSRLLQPRFGFNWNLGTKERRMQLRGGVGLFQGAAANVWLSNPFSNTGVAINSLNCRDYVACQRAGYTFNPDPDKQPGQATASSSPNVDFVSSSLEQPSVWKTNLAFDTELPPLPVVGSLVATAEWLYTRVKSAIYYQNLNLGAPTKTGTDGRELYYNAIGYNGTYVDGRAPSGTDARSLRNRAFSNVYLATQTTKGDGNAITLSIGKPANNGLNWNLAYTLTTATEVSPLTSSTSSSNWGNRKIFNPNEDVVQNSNYLIKDRITASVGWSQAFISNYRTSVGMFYEGRKGKPYTWTYINDLNGDGRTANDLMYIPSGPGSGEVVFAGGAAEEARFWEVVNAHKELSQARGGVVGRNNATAPWVNNVDVRFSQELPGFLKDHKTTFVLDILNFGNLLNRKWGHINEIDFPSRRQFVNYNGLTPDGRYIYSLSNTVDDYNIRQASGESQWAVQATLRYEF
ncbi:MAG: TonB-dependent receptor [Pseudomonadota bacterium]|nr:TonB-dependent receptor [Pseudomonadota bacterium]